MAKVDVFIVAGQSNAVGKGTASLSPSVPTGHGYEVYGGAVTYAVDPIGAATNGSAWPAFINACYGATGRAVAIIPTAVSTTALVAAADSGAGNWSPTGTMFNASVAATTTGMNLLTTAGHIPTLCGVLWSQGERDAGAGITQPVYEAALADLINRYQIALSTPTLPLYVFRTGRLTSGDSANWVAIRAAQDAVAAVDADVTMVYTNAVNFVDSGWMDADGVHYTQAGYNDMGAVGGAAVGALLPVESAPVTTLDFPASPHLNQEYTGGGRTWYWDGVAWLLRTATDEFLTKTIGVFNPVDYGADPTGATHSNDAFRAMWEDIRAISDTADQMAYTKIIIPPGKFLITEEKAFMGDPTGWGSRTAGIVIEGAGVTATGITFRPSADNQFLCYLADQHHSFTMRDIRFRADSTTNLPNFMDAYSKGGPKDSVFDRCQWSGKWQKGIKFRGADTNAQWSWNSCTWRGNSTSFVEGFLWSSTTEWVNDATTPDGASYQFKNYWINNSVISLDGGKFISSGIGLAPLHVNNCVMQFEGAASGKPGTMFEFRHNALADNSSKFSCTNTYFELWQDTQWIIDSKWNRGYILWENCTYDGAGGTFISSTSISERYDRTSPTRRLPSIVHRGCAIKGRHEYIYGTDMFRDNTTSVYEDCMIEGPASATDFILFTALDSTRLGGQPGVDFTRCKFPDDTAADLNYSPSDATPMWHRTMSARPRLHRNNYVSPRGDMPRSIDSLWRNLPLGALLVAIEMRIFSGGSTSTTWVYTVTDNTPTTICTFGGDSIYPLNSPTRQRIDGLNWYCDTDLTRQIKITSTHNTVTYGEFILEYLA